MEWSYVSGYFDGEGHVNFSMTKRGRMTTSIAWTNTHLASLQSIKSFMRCGVIGAGRTNGLGKKLVYQLTISNRSDLIKVLPMMIPHLLIKAEKCESLLSHVTHKVSDKGRNAGKLERVSAEELSAMYESGMSLSAIATRLGVTPSGVCMAMNRHGIKRRPAGGSQMRGVPKSEDTKRRMRDARRALWSDPEFAAKQKANLSRGRAILAAMR